MGKNHRTKFVGHCVCLSSGKKFVKSSLAATLRHGAEYSLTLRVRGFVSGEFITSYGHPQKNR